MEAAWEWGSEGEREGWREWGRQEMGGLGREPDKSRKNN